MEIIEFLEENKVGKSFLKLVTPFISHEWNMKRKIDNAELQFKIDLRKAENEGQVNLQKKKNELEVKKEEIENQYELDQFKQDVLNNWFEKESRYQNNVDEVVYRSVKYIKEDAKPENVDEDKISILFENVKHISKNEAQEIWAKVLAREINEPESISKRTMELLKNITLKEAQIFSKVASLALESFGDYFFLKNNGFLKNEFDIKFEDLILLKDLGLIHSNDLDFSIKKREKDSKITNLSLNYQNKQLAFRSNVGKIFKLQVYKFTTIGEELIDLVEKNFYEKYLQEVKDTIGVDKNTDFEIITILQTENFWVK